MTSAEEDIRRALKEERLSVDQALLRVRDLLSSGEARGLLVFQATLIQLSEVPGLTLQEAQRSLERAVALAPEHPEAYEELGHFFDAVVPDPQKAEKMFRMALQRGAGEACQRALDELLAERG